MSKPMLVLTILALLLSFSCSDSGKETVLSPENQLVVVATNALGQDILVPLYCLHDTIYARNYVVGSVCVPDSMLSDGKVLAQFLIEFGKGLETYTSLMGSAFTGNDSIMVMSYFNFSLSVNWSGVIIYDTGSVEYRFDHRSILVGGIPTE